MPSTMIPINVCSGATSAKMPPYWGWGFAQVWRRFFSGFHLPERRNVQTDCLHTFLVRRFLCSSFCADVLGADFCTEFCCADLCADSPQIFLRRFGTLKPGVPETRKNAHKICSKLSGVPMALPNWVRVSGHRGIFAPTGMLASAPRSFTNENLRNMRSANH